MAATRGVDIKRMGTLGKGFLRFVGLEYVALGVIGLVALGSGSRNSLAFCGLVTPFLLVAPLALVVENGIQAGCFGQPRAPWGCNLGTYEIQQARSILMVLCIISIAGGALGIWGAWTQRRSAGRIAWLVLTVISVAVALWNLEWFIFDSFSTNPLIGPTSMLWAAAYAFASFQSFRKQHLT
jgi:hypothetical protein